MSYQGSPQGYQQGYQQPQGYPPQFSRRQESSGSGVTIAIVIVLVLLLVLGGGAVIYMMSNSADKAAADKAAAAKAKAAKAKAAAAAVAANPPTNNPPTNNPPIDRDEASLPSPNYTSDVPVTPVGDPIDRYVGNYNNNGAWVLKSGPSAGVVVTSDNRRSPAVVQSNGELKASFVGDSNCCTMKLVGNDLQQTELNGNKRGSWTKTGTDTSAAPAAPTTIAYTFPGFGAVTGSGCTTDVKTKCNATMQDWIVNKYWGINPPGLDECKPCGERGFKAPFVGYKNGVWTNCNSKEECYNTLKF